MTQSSPETSVTSNTLANHLISSSNPSKSMTNSLARDSKTKTRSTSKNSIILARVTKLQQRRLHQDQQQFSQTPMAHLKQSCWCNKWRTPSSSSRATTRSCNNLNQLANWWEMHQSPLLGQISGAYHRILKELSDWRRFPSRVKMKL